jgi:DNA-binding GntR family transcriptional regulator
MTNRSTQRDEAEPASDPIRHYMLGDQIKDHLLGRILEGDLPPGARIVETRVARDLGISQGPVREALRDLASLGLVDLQPYRGARVREVTRDEHLEAMRVRGELETMAARQAAGRLNGQQIAHLRALVREMADLAARGDAHGHALRNSEFHGIVAEASGNRTLQRVLGLLQPFAQTYLTVTSAGLESAQTYQERHGAILDALVAGDPEQVDEVMRAHNEASLATVRDSVSDDTGSPEAT